MPTAGKEELFARIRVALVAGVREFLTALGQAQPGETMYGFLFELAPEGTHAEAAAATEEGLLRVVERYVELGYMASEGETATVLRAWLRWAGPEDGWFQGNDNQCFEAANALLDIAIASGFLTPFDDELAGLAIGALRELDAEGCFGTLTEREQVAIGLCYTGGDNTDEEFLDWAEQVNPPSTMARLRREIIRSCAAEERSISPFAP